MPAATISAKDRASLKEVFLKWHGKISTRYYSI
jgi:hypothetical protein